MLRLSIVQLTSLCSLVSAFSVSTQSRPLYTMTPPRQQQEDVSFSHVQLYVDKLEDLHVYKQLEGQLNDFYSKSKPSLSIQEKQALWTTISHNVPVDDAHFPSHSRSVVKQLLAGLNFRVTAARYASDTRSVLVTSKDPHGVQILVTAAAAEESSSDEKKHDFDNEESGGGMFNRANVHRFFAAHGNRQGIAVLGFTADNVERIRDNYMELHPNLIADYDQSNQILEVFAYYQEHGLDEPALADPGTILRFVQKSDDGSSLLTGLQSVSATFPETSQPAYCDHWVSNVHSRTEFMHTLHDTLGFTPKVDFNAGVVAAGEAQIESTVIGNDSTMQTAEKMIALKDQSQVYLPINNALSTVGHVYGFLQEIGQGIQHLASRVDDLVGFVQTANENRMVFGEGFTFLNIPRSYYGILTLTMLTEGIRGDNSDSVTGDCALAIFEALLLGSAMEADGAVSLEASRDDLYTLLRQSLVGESLEEFRRKSDFVLDIILRARYSNLYSLLRDHICDETYIRIVRNKILVDVQGEDLLYQIFTCNILQRNAGDEAPFFEFIQRVCSECLDESGCPRTLRPGCGGFGIRNFLTLFLSIEVSKAMRGVAEAKKAGDSQGLVYSQTMVDYFTAQMNEANPILTRISDAMTEEGHCRDNMMEALAANKLEEVEMWTLRMDAAAKEKEAGNQDLMECSARYNALMKELRMESEKQIE
ncbi:hypothetical protein MPSEU_000920000 [Mayamaea pseudoterrestris]|nr:hypothetical protein MPSEU_000920000 [Mayamaea pseudoterrestris]